MRVSVVINTYNRGPSLRATLRALRHQTHDAFEVVVVNGPSTDDSEAVLTEFAGDIRVARCPDVHLSKSRTAGNPTTRSSSPPSRSTVFRPGAAPLT